MAAEPDDDLLRRFVEGDRDAFEWLFRQFEREFYYWIRRIVRQGVPTLDETRLAAPAAPDTEVGEAVALAFARLPPRLQIVATLALIEECPYLEIAEALDGPIGTVKSRMFRAIRALRRELIDLGVER
jgi:RNA polymerase sigma-70 factor (ECF subfamily)